jgi:hypothetical protein
MAINYGVTLEIYIEGLESELAALTGKSDDTVARRALVEAELKTARGEPASEKNAQGTPLE